MTHCKHCGSQEDKYVMIYEKENNQSVQVDLWTFHDGKHIRVGSISNLNNASGKYLRPLFFCAKCHSLLPFPKSKNSISNKVKA